MSDGTGHRQGRLSEYWCFADFVARMWCSAEESRFADETVNNDADVLFCPVDKISAVLRRKKEPCRALLTSLALFFCRETPVKQENQAHMETSALQYGTKTNSHMQNSKTSQKKSWKSQNNTLISHISCVYFRVQEESEEKREKPDPLVLLGPLDQKDHQEMMVLKEALYVLTIKYTLKKKASKWKFLQQCHRRTIFNQQR